MSVPQALLADRYRLITVIATGGMGVVWEAWDERLGRSVAIKQLRTQPGATEVEAELAKNRAMREARITARLHHPNAVPVFDAVEHDGQPCLVMRFLPSTPLSAVLRERGTLSVPVTARIGAEIASALAAAHRLKIVHRDVKPGNILITADGVAHISDFGISHTMGDATLTRTGMVYGTPAYLAPEAARGGDATYKSDVLFPRVDTVCGVGGRTALRFGSELDRPAAQGGDGEGAATDARRCAHAPPARHAGNGGPRPSHNGCGRLASCQGEERHWIDRAGPPSGSARHVEDAAARIRRGR